MNRTLPAAGQVKRVESRHRRGRLKSPGTKPARQTRRSEAPLVCKSTDPQLRKPATPCATLRPGANNRQKAVRARIKGQNAKSGPLRSATDQATKEVQAAPTTSSTPPRPPNAATGNDKMLIWIKPGWRATLGACLRISFERRIALYADLILQ